MRRFLALFILIYMSAAAPWPAVSIAYADVPDAIAADDPMPVGDPGGWTNVYDFQERNAFSNYGPPLEEDSARFEAETKLYQDMLDNFYTIDSDEDDFSFVAEAFSVPVEEFRPASFRPDPTATGDLFEDDPLPESVKSSSAYVTTIRPSVLPGEAFRPRSVNEVKLGDENVPRSLFFEKPTPPVAEEKPKEEVKKAEADDKDKKDDTAGHINKPKKPEAPIPGSDQETLQLLQQAVRELGLEKQLNFESKTASTLAQMHKDGDTDPHAAADAAQTEEEKRRAELEKTSILGNSSEKAGSDAKPADAKPGEATPADAKAPEKPAEKAASTPAEKPAEKSNAKPGAKPSGPMISIPALEQEEAPKPKAAKPRPASRLIANKPAPRKARPAAKPAAKKKSPLPIVEQPAPAPVQEAPPAPEPAPENKPTSGFSMKRGL